MSKISLNQLVIGLKGAGEMASAIACRLYQANFHRIYMMETSQPLAVRRKVSFSEAVHDGSKAVEEVEARRVDNVEDIHNAWDQGKIAVRVDPEWETVSKIKTHVVIDAILAKKNLGTTRDEAPLVIGLGPGFCAGDDVHLLLETNRGHNLGRIIVSGSAEPNTGVPGTIGGYSQQRVLRISAGGIFHSKCAIGDQVRSGDVLATVGAAEVRAEISGVVRGLIRSGVEVTPGLKVGDIDPRGDVRYCYTISDKGRAIAGAVLESILRVYNT